jgi:hypothetical protein
MPLREAVGEVPDATSEATTISAAFALRGILSGFQIGGAYHFYNRFAKPAAHDGFSAGLFYRAPDEASWLSLGFFYFYAPDNLAVRRPVDGLAHDSFNIGIAFDFDFVQLSIDLRNIGDYGEEGGFHFGVEYSRVFDPEMGGVLRFGAFSNSSQSFQDHAGFSFGAVLRFVPREWGRADETRRALTRDQAFIEMGITRVHDNLYGNYWFISFGGWFFPF